MKTNQRIARLALLAGLVTLVARAEEAASVNEPTINVRGQASFMGEVITQLKQGEKVVILEEISVSNPKKDEPAKWAKIQMPANTPVWVNAMFIDPETKTVKPNRLNLRGGPGENYSVVGRLQRGDQVKDIRTVDDWMEIETPPGAYAFVAAHLLSKEAPVAAIAAVAQPEPTPVQPAPVQPAPAETNAANLTARQTPVLPPPVTEKTIQPETAPAAVVDSAAPKNESTPPVKPPIGQPRVAVVPPVESLPSTELVKPDVPVPAQTPPKRIVRREGVVRGTVSIQAPTYYELIGSDNNRVINYLHLNPAILDKLETTVKDFKHYVGRVVVVTGEEGIDPRWPDTPVIEVETLKLVL